MNNPIQLGVYRTHEQAQLPQASTPGSACWDLHACLPDGARVQVFNEYNESMTRVVQESCVSLFEGERMLVPTGCVFDIPQGYSMRLHPRSGISVKQGISLINCEGVVDSDYVQETLVALVNHSAMTFVITHGDRVAQMEVIPQISWQLQTQSQAPEPRTHRQGGFGSTGIRS